MTIQTRTNLQAIFDDFRSLGGIAENIQLGSGRRGRGLFAIDPNRPVQIRVPSSLLFPIEDMLLVEGKLRMAPHTCMGQRAKAFFEHYQNCLSWSAGGRSEVTGFFELLHSLPERARSCLITDFGLEFLFASCDEQAIARRFLHARKINFHGRPVLMPILELANHSGRFPALELHSNSIVVNRTFPDGEVLVSYNRADSWLWFVQYGFVMEERYAYSLPINVRLPSALLNIGFDLSGHAQDGLVFPKVTVTGGRIALSHLLLGDRQMPHAPRRIFIHAVRETGLREPSKLFDRISHHNRKAFLKLMALLEDQDGHAAVVLRRLARIQLEALSFAMG